MFVSLDPKDSRVLACAVLLAASGGGGFGDWRPFSSIPICTHAFNQIVWVGEFHERRQGRTLSVTLNRAQAQVARPVDCSCRNHLDPRNEGAGTS